ncbi:MAG: aminotransferase class III-fold pyridoxal phosphate-dependent enzyme [Candidatus Eremiobacteraeota bacterium]|nr:aminotransferase class III-fold pyridoxal phosphate-dependent enzyme [Candidatus Eremiobacteraeota bacterium]
MARRKDQIDTVKREPIAGGCSTISKLPLIVTGHTSPGRAVSAQGARFTDEHNVTWLDFDMALGSVIWGHGREEFADSVRRALIECGAASVPTVLEHEAAQRLLHRLERYEQARFFKGGADACSAAVRIGRAATGRQLIAVDGYHGWHDWSAACAYSETPLTLGILPEVKEAVRFLDPNAGIGAARDALLPFADRVAAVIVRPEVWTGDAIAALRAHCDLSGMVLIFDEITSHYKYGRTGVAGALNIWPDLLCISKGLANGLPLAALVGPKRLMQYASLAHISATYASESTALAALITGENLLCQAIEWPSWRREVQDVIQRVQATLERLGLAQTIEVIDRYGFFSVQSIGMPFKADAVRMHIVGHLTDQQIFTRGWFHGSDRHDPSDWQILGQHLDAALESWLEKSDRFA